MLPMVSLKLRPLASAAYITSSARSIARSPPLPVDHLHAHEQSQSANVADDRVFPLHGPHAFERVVAEVARVLQQAFDFDHFDGGERGRAGATGFFSWV